MLGGGNGGVLPDRFDQLEAVHLRQVDVAQQQPVRRAPAGRRPQFLQRLAAVRHAADTHAPGGEHPVEDGEVGRVVIDGQHGHAAKRRRCCRHGLVGARRLAEREVEEEPAAAAGVTLHVDGSAHQRPTRREQMVSPRPVPPNRRVVLPSAWENASKMVRCFSGGDSDARVGHLELDRHVVVGSRDDTHAQRHVARVGELDGVADQIQHDLPQARRVAHEHVRHVLGHVVEQLQALVRGARGQGLQRGAERRPKLERDALDLEPAGFDLGEVEDVVDDRQQGVGRRLHQVQAVALLWRQLAVQDQLGHAEDAVHAACGSRGSCWPGTRSWPGWRPRRPPWPRAGRASAVGRGDATPRPTRTRQGARAAGDPPTGTCARGSTRRRVRAPARRRPNASRCENPVRDPVTGAAS